MQKKKCGSSKGDCGARAADDRGGVTELRGRLEKSAKTRDIKVTLRIAGGMPDERIEEEVQVSGTGRVSFKASDMLKKSAPAGASGTLDADELRELLAEVAAGAEGTEGLCTRAQARFLPDSVIGRLTVEAGGQKTDLFFLSDEGERKAQKKVLSPRAAAVIGRLRAFRGRLKAAGKGGRRA
jgi:hypothetical protein